MRHLNIISALFLALLLLGSCRSQSALKKQKEQMEQGVKLMQELISAPPVTELTASLSLNINGTKVSGQLRMRYGRSIQISASVLGLMEVARVEFLPDRVVVMDKMHNIYSVCHYADIPYRNELGLEFNVVQSLLWNRIFSPGCEDSQSAVSQLQVLEPDKDGNVRINERQYGYSFMTDGRDKLNAVTKVAAGYGFKMNYTDFTKVSGKWEYPQALSVEISDTETRNNITVKLSSVSTDRKDWPDRTQVNRRMKQVSLDELLDNL